MTKHRAITIGIALAAAAVGLGYLMKSGREAIAKDAKAEPLAKKLGLI